MEPGKTGRRAPVQKTRTKGSADPTRVLLVFQAEKVSLPVGLPQVLFALHLQQSAHGALKFKLEPPLPV